MVESSKKGSRGQRLVGDRKIQPLLLSIPEVAASLRLSRAKVYMLIDVEGLPVVRFGRAVRVSVISLQQWLERREKSA